MALNRDITWTGCDEDDPRDREAHQAWERLAAADTHSEFSAAWQVVGEGIAAPAAPHGDGSPAPLRAFTAAQVAWAAAAITDAPW
jgi:hypothetical protein